MHTLDWTNVWSRETFQIAPGGLDMLQLFIQVSSGGKQKFLMLSKTPKIFYQKTITTTISYLCWNLYINSTFTTTYFMLTTNPVRWVGGGGYRKVKYSHSYFPNEKTEAFSYWVKATQNIHGCRSSGVKLSTFSKTFTRDYSSSICLLYIFSEQLECLSKAILIMF